MRGLYKRADSKFWWVSYIDITGKLRQVSTRTTSQREAKAFLEKRKREALTASPAVKRKREDVPIEVFAEEYLAWQQSRQKSFRTLVRDSDYQDPEN